MEKKQTDQQNQQRKPGQSGTGGERQREQQQGEQRQPGEKGTNAPDRQQK